jgi:hypothetical protein
VERIRKMQIIIEIDEKDKQYLDKCLKGKGLAFLDNAQLIKRVVLAIFHGNPLPKGYGRLGDLDALREEVYSWDMNDYDRLDFVDAIDNAPTIIEADRSEKE